ncbi:MAG: thiamine-phosphate kinase [Bacteroidota bacterium]
MDQAGYTPVSALGEFRLIDRMTSKFSSYHEQVLKGIGDDAAVVKTADGMVDVISTDLLIEKVHFDLSYVPLKHLGYKAVIVNLSDVVAMNAQPYGITVSIGMSNRFPVEALDELYAGIHQACKQYNVNLLGGDTTSSKVGLVISITALGREKEEKITYRSGAQKNDLVCVSGDLGGAYAGYLILEREKRVFLDKPELQPDLSDYDYVVGRQLKPEARIDILQTLEKVGVQPTAMVDVSDGIASEIHHICNQSKCGAKIYSNKLPIDFQTVSVAEEFKISQNTFALNGGEDYELMFTIPLADFSKIQRVPEIQVIGSITEEKNSVFFILDDGSQIDLEAQGFQHFSSEELIEGNQLEQEM